MTDKTIFSKISLDKELIKWSDYLYELTPIEKVGNLYFKREDYFAPLGYIRPNGSKMRQAIYLFEKALKNNPNLKGVIGGTSVRSPQISMSAILAKYYGLESIQVIGATRSKAALKHYNIEIANYFKSKFYVNSCTYNSALQHKVKSLLDENKYSDYRYIPYGISPFTLEAVDVEEFHRIGAEQAKNIPDFILNLILPTGSGNSTISVLYGVSLFRPKSLKNIYLIGIGPCKLKTILKRLKAIESVTGVNTRPFKRFYYDHPELQEEMEEETKDKEKPYNVHYIDLMKRKLYTYSDLVEKSHHDIEFHPTYEAKVYKFLEGNMPQLLENSLFWIIGSLANVDVILNNLNIKKFGKDLAELDIIHSEVGLRKKKNDKNHSQT